MGEAPATEQVDAVRLVNTTALPEAPPVADTEPVPARASAGAAPKAMAWLPFATATEAAEQDSLPAMAPVEARGVTQ